MSNRIKYNNNIKHDMVVTSEALVMSVISRMLGGTAVYGRLKSFDSTLSVTVRGRKFQMDGTVQRKACCMKAVLENGSDSTIAVDERKVRRLSRVVTSVQKYCSFSTKLITTK